MNAEPVLPLRVDTRATSRLRFEFWTAFREHATKVGIVRCGRASSDSWMHHNGHLNGGTLFTMVRVRQGEIVTQFALDGMTASTIYSFLKSHHREVDAAFSEVAQWRTAGIRTHEIEVRRHADIADKQEWPQHFDWFVRQLAAFQHALWPLVGRLPPTGTSRQWNEHSFFAELEAHTPPAVIPAREVLRWSQANMPLIDWGCGKRFGSFVPKARRQGRLYAAVSLWTSGAMVLRFADLKKEWPFCEASLRLDLLERFNRVPHLSLPPEAIDSLPAIPLPILAEPGSLARFLDALAWFLGVVKSR
jgi:hypothetical protein